ncbi:MAG: hypothetical protein ABSB82_24750 [Terriglobia bacterium]|jgi:hypothetical protein
MRALGDEVGTLWSDAMRLFLDAHPSSDRIKPERKRRLLRAAVLTAAGAFESLTNFLSEMVIEKGSVEGRPLDAAEIDALRETRRFLEGGRLKERKQLYNSKDRFMFLYQIISGGKEYESGLAGELNASFGVRDRLVHPKPGRSTEIFDVPMLSRAFFGFLRADMVLAAEWERRNS